MVNWVSYTFFLNLVRLIYYTASETKANAKDKHANSVQCGPPGDYKPGTFSVQGHIVAWWCGG